MTHDVFISYSHHDKSAADAVCAKLEQHGIRCWIAPRDVEPGTEWAGSIIHAISKTKIMVLVFSKNANDSPQIRKEVERAVNKGVIVVPLRIEDVVPTESLEYFMSNVHWLDALTPPLEQHLDHLAGTVKIMLDRMVISDPPALVKPPDLPSNQEFAARSAPKKTSSKQFPDISAPPRANATGARKTWRREIIAGAALLLILVAAGYLARRTPQPPQFAEDQTISHDFLITNTAVFSVAFSPDGHWLASGGADRTVKLWDVSTGKQLRMLEPHRTFVASIAFSPDGRWLASGTAYHSVQIWDASTGSQVRTLPDSLAIDYDSAGEQWLALMAKSPQTLPASPPISKSPAFGEKPARPATTGPLIDRVTVLSSFLSSDYIDGVVFSPDSRWIASGSAKDNTVELWDVATGTQLRTLTGHTKSVTTVAFSPTGTLLASASADKTIKIWDPATGHELRTLLGHSDGVRCVAFSPDGRWLASASDDHTVKVWEAASGQLLRTLSGHSASVHSVAFSPDGIWLASAGADEAVKLWNASTGREVSNLQAPYSWIESLVFSPDGRRIAAGYQNGKVVLWHRTN